MPKEFSKYAEGNAEVARWIFQRKCRMTLKKITKNFYYELNTKEIAEEIPKEIPKKKISKKNSKEIFIRIFRYCQTELTKKLLK